MSFPCTKCGQCCKNIDKVKELSYLDRGDGTCIKFLEGEGCSIYDSRPILCRIDDGYDRFFSNIITRSNYYKGNADVCNSLQREMNLDESFRVNI